MVQFPLKVYFLFPSSLGALNAFKNYFQPGELFGYYSSYRFWFSTFKVINYISILILIYICLRGELTEKELLISTFVILANFSISTGGYILLIYIPLVAYMIPDHRYKGIMLSLFGIFSVPWDWITIFGLQHNYILSYLGGNLVLRDVTLYFGLGSLIRPILNFSIVANLIFLFYKKLPARSL